MVLFPLVNRVSQSRWSDRIVSHISRTMGQNMGQTPYIRSMIL